jgi:pimeloyl-ACP methyl ester carboxylesterase
MNPMESMRQALRTHDDELFLWSTWADPMSGQVDLGPDELPGSAEASLDVALSLAEASWRSKTCDDSITCVLTIPDSDDVEVSIEAPFGALVMYPGSLTMKLAFKFKKPVGFALALIRNKGVMPSQLADSIHRSLRDSARKRLGVEDLVSIFDMTEAALNAKSYLLLFVHGLISTDLGLFDSLIRRLRTAIPTAQLVGYPHNTFSSIETNAVVLADWIEKLLAGNDMPLAFVCHSRGGLVARTASVELRERNNSWVQRLRGCVTFGTPHEGAAFAEVAEDFFPTFASLATLNGTRNVLSSIDVLTYYGAGGKFEGIEDLRPLTGAGSTRERFLKKLREREGRVKRIDLLAFGGRITVDGQVAKLTRRFLAGHDSDQVVELSSSTPDLLKPHERIVTTCNHFDYFADTKENQENLAAAQQYIWKVLQ